MAEREAGLQAYLEGLEGLVPPALRDAAQKAAVRHFFGRRWDSLLQASQPFIILLPPPLSPIRTAQRIRTIRSVQSWG